MVPKIVKEEVRNPGHAAHHPVQVSKRILFNFISSMALDWLDSYRVSHIEVDSFSASFLASFSFRHALCSSKLKDVILSEKPLTCNLVVTLGMSSLNPSDTPG